LSELHGKNFFGDLARGRVVLIDAATLQKAQRMIAGCEACSDDAEIPFDNILDRITGSDPSVTDYVLEARARCLQCGAKINEKTLVEPSRRLFDEFMVCRFLSRISPLANPRFVCGVAFCRCKLALQPLDQVLLFGDQFRQIEV
jgi:hypothetical protein